MTTKQPHGRLFELNISFLLRTSYRFPNGEHPIVLRLKYRGEKKDVNTGLKTLPENWLSGGGCVIPKARKAVAINQQLHEIAHRCKTVFEKLKTLYGDFSLNEIIDKLKGNDEAPETLLEYVSGQLHEYRSRVGVDLAITTYYKYKRAERYLEEYLNQKMSLQNIPVTRVDQQFLEGFFKFLRREKRNANNSAVALMNCLKTILNEPVKKGIIRYNPFVSISLTQQPVKRDYLTTEEIKTLQQLSGLTEAMERNKDLFLFACFTGLAYSDIASLKSHHIIIDPDGSKHIEKYRNKTGILSYIPLLPVAERILLKYSPTVDCRDFNWRVPSNQKLNLALKEIARLAGLEKNIFMHLARHTFATTVTLSNGVPLETVGKMIGHSGMKNLMIYAKIVNNKVKKDMEGVMGIDFSKRMQSIVEKYNQRDEQDTLRSEVLDEFTDEIINLYHALKKEKDSFKDLGIDFEEKAFYDILKALALKYDFVYPEYKLIPLSQKVKSAVDDKAKYTDWSKRTDIKAELKAELIILLAENDYPPVDRDEVYKEIFEQAENFKKYNS